MKREDIIFLQNQLGVESDGVIGPITRGAYSKRIIDIALKDVGIFETSKNQGEGIEKYWQSTTYKDGYRNREPYCAAAVCYWIQQSGVFTEKNRPKSARAFDFEKWGDRLGLEVIKNPKTILRGDIVVFSFSHVGIALADSKGGKVSTVEANTQPGNTGNQRDGGGVHKRSRAVSVVRSIIRLG